jgi:hypothetical protein
LQISIIPFLRTGSDSSSTPCTSYLRDDFRRLGVIVHVWDVEALEGFRGGGGLEVHFVGSKLVWGVAVEGVGNVPPIVNIGVRY